MKTRRRGGNTRNAPGFDLRTDLFRMCGVDLTRIDGINATTALGTKITGGKVPSGKSTRVTNRTAQALRLAAAAPRSSQSALGAYFRRMCAHMDKPKAVTAAAHKPARLIYTC